MSADHTCMCCSLGMVIDEYGASVEWLLAEDTKVCGEI